MSKLDELINEICPDGVEYKRICEFADTNIGLATSVTANKANSGVQLLHNSDIQPNKIVVKKYEYVKEFFAEKNKKKVFKLHDIITVHTGDVGTSAVIEKEYVGTIGFTTITTRIRNFDEVDPYYLCHYLNSHRCKSDIAKDTISDRNNLNQKSFEQLQIPLPDLRIQREIVHILDSFTLLTAELTAELTARRQQYEFYRDYLLNFEDDSYSLADEFGTITNKGIIYEKMGKVCLLKAGKSIPSVQISNIESSTFQYACYGGNGIRGYVADYNYDGDYPLIGRQGALCGNVNYARGKFYATEHAVVVSTDVFDKRFLFHLLTNLKLNQYKTAGAQPGLSVKTLNEVVIPVPPIETQKKIVAILDRFDKLANDMSEGLPAEIEARKQQYEYYRDVLLSFDEERRSQFIKVERERAVPQ